MPGVTRAIPFCLLAILCCGAPKDLGPAYSGGETTVFIESSLAFSTKVQNLRTEKLPNFTFGNRLFNTNWVTAPASTESFDGLGPFFNRVSCSGCHLLDGRGQPPATPTDMMDSMLVRISIPGESKNGGPNPHPVYGDQISDRAIVGIKPEGRVTVRYTEEQGKYPDGQQYSLRRPEYRFENMNYGPLGRILFSPRVAPAVFGLGLLEAIPEKEILKTQSTQPVSVRGKPNYVYNAITGGVSIGRFGWKANVPTLRQQNLGAARGDVGLTSSLFPEENITPAQVEALKVPNGGSPEIKEEFTEDLDFYTRTLGVPARRNLKDAEALAGEKIFSEIGCANCHAPRYVTGEHPAGVTEVSNQVIHPYTDLLLHDMGPALADGRSDFQANGNEWRTAPLWGIGLIQAVNRHTNLLHDGRARNIEEAILWHGGQAESSRELFKSQDAKGRAALLKFLQSL